MPYDAHTGIYTSEIGPAHLPDPTLSIFDFVFDSSKAHERASRTWLIDSQTGRTLSAQDAYERTLALARAFHRLGLGAHETLVVYSSNEVCPLILVLR